MLADALGEGLADRVQLDCVGAVGGEVTGSAVLACVEGSDLPVEALGLLFEVGEVPLRHDQLDVGLAAFPPRTFATLQRDDGLLVLAEPGLDLASGLPHRPQVG